MEIESIVEDALEHLGIEARPWTGSTSADLILDLDGATTTVELKRRSLVDEAAASRLLSAAVPAGAVLLVVGDRVTEGARRRLLGGGAGYLDLRGHLGLRAKGMVINADVPGSSEKAERTDALAGKAGLEVATRLLMSPTEPVAVRSLARELGRSASTVSGVLGALRREGLIDKANTFSGTTLFWRVVEKWPSQRTYVASAPSIDDAITAQALRHGLDTADGNSGWALTDTAAAAEYGAPVAVRSEQRLDFFVPDESVLRRAVRLLGAADAPERAGASLRVAPVPRVSDSRVPDTHGTFGWPLAHPLFVALDLAQDAGRGREILDAWLPDERWTRVW